LDAWFPQFFYHHHRILQDYKGIEKTSLETIKQIVVEFGEQMRQKGEVDMKAAAQFRKVRRKGRGGE